MNASLVFGTGGRFGRLSIGEASELVKFAFDNGICAFDTGVNYCNGRSQPKLFECFNRIAIDRSKYYLCSKVSATLLNLPEDELIDLLFSEVRVHIKYLDVLMIWGPSLADLANPFILKKLLKLKSLGLIRCIGVNTHHSKVMKFLAENASLSFIDDLMVDYNILQKSRAPLIKSFRDYRAGRSVWAGTVLCQGFLLQSLVSMYLRTRSLSYLARAILNPPTRRYAVKASSIRRLLRDYFSQRYADVPLSYVLNSSDVDFVPLGMLSKMSISRNLKIFKSPVPQSSICSFVDKLPASMFVDDVFQ